MTRETEFQVTEDSTIVWVWWYRGVATSEVHASFGYAEPTLRYQGLPHETAERVFLALKEIAEIQPLCLAIRNARERWGNREAAKDERCSYLPLSIHDAEAFLAGLQEVAA